MEGMLELAVQSVEWTYSLFWRFSTQQRMLVWGDGYYNGPIKTTKTMHPAPDLITTATQQSSLHRTQQLRDLYNSLSTRHPHCGSSAALSPEDLTESEWFYLLSLSFSFPSGFGLPGKAFAKKKHVWITGANEIDTKIFSRAILAKSASIKTVVCIPQMDGVVELGTTDKVKEDLGFIQHIKSIFAETQSVAPKPAVSEISTSNSATSLEHYYNHLNSTSAAAGKRKKGGEMDSDSSTSNSNSNNAGGCPCWSVGAVGGGVTAGEPSELIMQLELSEDIRLGSPEPDDASNNFLPMPNSHNKVNFECHPPSLLTQPYNTTHLQPVPPPPGKSPAAVAELTEEDTHYSNTLSVILLNQNQSSRWPDRSSVGHVTSSTQSAFSKWTRCSDLHCVPTGSTSTSQCLLKHILHTIPFLHTKHQCDHDPSKSKSKSISISCDGRCQKKAGTSQDELSGNHFLARHEMLNDKFIILRSIVPFATKMDKASILGDTVEYLKQLRQKIQDLEAQNREWESSRRSNFEELQRNAAAHRTCLNKRKVRILEGVGDGCTKHKVLKSPPRLPSPISVDTNLEVSIIGSDGLLELQCPYKEGLLLDILLILQGLRIDITAVRSSLSNGVFIAELRAKVKEKMDGKKASILEVKRAIQQIIPCIDT